MATLKKRIILDKEGKDTGEVEGPDEGYLAWLARQGAIGAAETPGAFTALYGLAGATKDYLYDAATGAGKEKGFKDYLYDPAGGTDKLKAYNDTVIESLRRSYPDMDDDALQQRFEKVQKHSKKYYKDVSEFMRPGLSFARKWQLGANELLGDPRLPTERTQSDTLVNILGSSLPLPGAGSMLAATGSTGAKIAASKLGKVALNVAEVATPATIPATKGRFAANVGVGVGVDQAGRIVEDQPSVVRDFYKTDDGTASVAAIGASGAAAAVVGGLALKNLHKIRGTNPVVSGGPPSSTMQQAAHPDANLGVSNVLSDVAPVKKMLREQARLTDEELEEAMAVHERHAGPMPVGDHKNWEDQKLTPVMERLVREDPAFQQQYMQHRADRSRLYSDDAAILETDAAIAEATKKLQSLQRGPVARRSTTLINNAQTKLNDLQLERNARLADSDPNLRTSLMNESRADVQARVAQSSRNPKIRAMEQTEFKLYDDIVDVNINSGLVSPHAGSVAKANIRKGNFTLNETPLNQKGWIGLKQKVSRWTEDHLVYADTDGALGLYRVQRNPQHRKGYIDTQGEKAYVRAQPNWVPEKRVNNPRDPITELQHMSIRTRQAAHANILRKNYVDAMMKSQGNANRRLMWPDPKYPNGRIHESQISNDFVDGMLKKMDRDKGPFPLLYYDRGDLVVMWHNNKTISDLFKFAPSQVIPGLNQTRKLAQFGMTGPGRPQWAAIGTVWDIMLGSGLRHPHMVFGPISGLSAEVAGRGSPIARLIGGIATPIDIAANLARLPYAAGRGVVQELFGNQIARRWQVQLEMNSGVISQIAKLDGGTGVIKGVVDAMVKGYQASITQMAKSMRVGHLTNYSDEITSHMRQLQDLGKKRPMYKSAINSYLSVLSVLHDVPKAMFLSQNVKLYKREVAKGRQIANFMSEEWIANEARKIGGDLARVSGDPRIQRTLSAIPYGNVSMQSIRFLGQRMRENPYETSLKLGALATGVGWIYHNIAMDEEGSNWFFNELPQEQRIQSIPLPNAWRFAQRMVGINVPRGTPQEEYSLVRMPPELMPIIIPVMHGMMALGFINTSKAIVPPAIGKDFGMMVDQVFGLGLPPPASAAFAAAGYKVEPSKLLTGDNMLREIRDNTFSGANKDKMSPESRIPHAWHDVFNAMFGTSMGTLMEAANYGDIVWGKTGDFGEGVKEGVKKLGVEQAARTPYSNHIWPDVNRRYIYTPATEKLQQDLNIYRKINDQMNSEPALKMLLGKKGGYSTNDYLQAMEGTSVGGMVQDPDLLALLADIHVNFFTGPYLKLQKERRLARRIHESMTIGVNRNYATNKESPLMRFKKAQEQAKEVNRLDQELYNIYQDVTNEMKTSPSGMVFEKRYGPLTPQNILKAIQGSARQGTQQSQPY